MPEVVVGLVIKKEKKINHQQSDGTLVLLCQRLKTARYALKWEFPGGKVDPHETLAQALVREMKEEIAIDILSFSPYFQQQNRYPDGGDFNVNYFLIENYSGDVANRIFESMKWVDVADLVHYDILHGNKEVVAKIIDEYATS